MTATDRLATAPNLVTLARIALVAAGAAAWGLDARGLGLALGVTGGLTDYLDGYLARRLGQTTRLGAMLDQFADAFMMLAALTIAIAPTIELSPVYLVVFASRELWVQGVRREAAALGLELPSSWMGKASSFLLGWGLVPVLLGAVAVLGPTARAIGELMVGLGLAAGLVAGAGYTRDLLAACGRA